MPDCLTPGVQRSTYQPNLRVGKPLFCEAWRPACRPTSMYTSSSQGSKQKADKNVDANFTRCLALREGKPLSAIQGQKPRNRLFRVFRLSSLSFLLSVSNNNNNNTNRQRCKLRIQPTKPENKIAVLTKLFMRGAADFARFR